MSKVKDEEDQLKEDKQRYLQETKRLKIEKAGLENEVVKLQQYKDLVQQLEAGGYLEGAAEAQVKWDILIKIVALMLKT